MYISICMYECIIAINYHVVMQKLKLETQKMQLEMQTQKMQLEKESQKMQLEMQRMQYEMQLRQMNASSVQQPEMHTGYGQQAPHSQAAPAPGPPPVMQDAQAAAAATLADLAAVH